MLDENLSARFAKSWMDAVMGYSTAAAAASTIATSQMFDVWSRALTSNAGTRETSCLPSMRGEPSPPAFPFAAMPNPVAMWADWMRTFSPASPAPALSNPMQIWALWPMMMPWHPQPAAFPMAVFMMAWGVPREVAVPAAEANAAALDATEAAAKSFDKAFSSYRSDGGHASAQVIAFKRLVAALMVGPLMAPAGFASLPWLNIARSY